MSRFFLPENTDIQLHERYRANSKEHATQRKNFNIETYFIIAGPLEILGKPNPYHIFVFIKRKNRKRNIHAPEGAQSSLQLTGAKFKLSKMLDWDETSSLSTSLCCPTRANIWTLWMSMMNGMIDGHRPQREKGEQKTQTFLFWFFSNPLLYELVWQRNVAWPREGKTKRRNMRERSLRISLSFSFFCLSSSSLWVVATFVWTENILICQSPDSRLPFSFLFPSRKSEHVHDFGRLFTPRISEGRAFRLMGI